MILNSDEVFGENVETANQDDIDRIHMILFVKDRFNVSGEAYHQMAQVCKAMPRHYKLKDRIVQLNRQWNLKPTPHATCGIQQSLEERLKLRVQHLHKVASLDAPFRQQKLLRVKTLWGWNEHRKAPSCNKYHFHTSK